jgi:catechol 2,3-dioxygenase-like lactoylglutathione lyase family enzyme
MLSHVSIGVSDIGRSKAFYEKVLASLGYVCVLTKHHAIGFGEPGGEDKLTLFAKPGQIISPGLGFHLAFLAPTQQAVDYFHAAAILAGGRDEGRPGPRPQYGLTYYAAYVTDLDGYKLEAHHQ